MNPTSQAPLSSDKEADALPILATVGADRPLILTRKDRLLRFFVFGFACLIFLPNLGAFGLWDPWETHYGAVSTEMLETGDWISPYWGYPYDVGGATQGAAFYSKPIFIFWSEATTAHFIGRGEWAIRLPSAMLAIMAVFMTFLTMRRIYGRKQALLASVILATAPFFYLVSRQAQTDMPFVALMTLALLFFMMAVLGKRVESSNRRFWRYAILWLAFVLLNTLPQYALLYSDFSHPSRGSVRGFPNQFLHQGAVHALFYLAILGIWLFSLVRSFLREFKEEGLSDGLKDRWFRKFQLFAFYILLAQATYAKGLLGFMLPGAILFFWLLSSHNWRVLKRLEITRGICIFFLTGLPWYLAMIVKHGQPYINRFFWHDHFNRLATGVHQIDSGTFEHFIKWLGVGMFPWVAFVPFALFWALKTKPRQQDPKNQALFFSLIWLVVSFTLFTLSSTKFHHYIFPALPALAFVTAQFILWILKEKSWMLRFSTALGMVFLLSVGLDLKEDPQLLRNLMTYKYDRAMPSHLPIDADAPQNDKSDLTWKDSTFWKHTSPSLQSVLTTKMFRYNTWTNLVLVLSFLTLLLFLLPQSAYLGLIGLALTASLMAAWSLSYYLPSLTPHWSQKYLFDAYYDSCTPLPKQPALEKAYEPILAKIGLPAVADYFRSEPKRLCEEDILSWLIVWRGETYYSYNEVKPIKKSENFEPYMESQNFGKKFYVITEKGRENTIKTQANRATKNLQKKNVKGFENIDHWEVKVENGEGHFFQTVSATPVLKEP